MDRVTPGYAGLFRLDGRTALVVGAGSGIGATAGVHRLDLLDPPSIEAAADALGPRRCS